MPIITSRETFTPGDAMRDIYTRGIITTDFVLVMGDLVSNVRIDEVVRVHKERRRMNKDAIMTMVVKESGGVHRTRWVLFVFFDSKGRRGVVFLSLMQRVGREGNRRYSFWIPRRRNVCIMNMLRDIRPRSMARFLGRF